MPIIHTKVGGKILKVRLNPDLQICPTVAAWELLTEKKIAEVEDDIIKVDENFPD